MMPRSGRIHLGKFQVFAALAVAFMAMASPLRANSAENSEGILAQITWENRVYFKEKTLRKFFTHKEGDTLDRALLEADRKNLEAKYKDRGFFQASVGLRVEKIPAGPTGMRFRAVFIIHAGERAGLKTVHFHGNRAVPDDVLRKAVFHRQPEPFGALTRAGFFHRPYLSQDEQRLAAALYAHGFLEGRVVSTRVMAQPDLSGIDLHFDIRKEVTIKDGEPANIVEIHQQVDALMDPLRDEGHPFVQIKQGFEMREPPADKKDHRAVLLRLHIDKGPRAHIRNIVIEGNDWTFDRVIRRDLSVQPGQVFSQTEVKKSQNALKRLGFFSQVEITPQRTENPQEVDLKVKVTEQPTWVFNIAPAFVGNEGLVLVGILAFRNFLGSGIAVSAIGQFSGLRQLFDVSVTEPRVFDTRIALTGEVHRRQWGYPAFLQRSIGGGVSARFPIKWGLGLSTGLTAEQVEVEPYLGEIGDEAIPAPVGVLRNPVAGSVFWDTRDSVLSPRNGVYADLRSSYAGPYTFSGLNFLEGEGRLKLYYSPFWNITWKSSTQLGQVIAPHGGQVPLTDRYFLGGYGSVRGFSPRSISPTALAFGLEEGVKLGGTRNFVQNLEVEFPLAPEGPFRGFLFVDAGNTYAEAENPLDATTVEAPVNLPLGLSWSTGFGIILQTPVIPFRFEWGLPLTRRPADRQIDFFFGVGSAI
jgi:outer membrane protein insertion porin family